MKLILTTQNCLFVRVFVACSLLCACTGTLEPAKSSDLVTLIADSTTPICPNTTNPHSFNDRLMPDGTRVPFAIPTGFVFVITSYDWVLEGSTQTKNNVWTAVTFAGAGKNNALFSASNVDSGGRAEILVSQMV